MVWCVCVCVCVCGGGGGGGVVCMTPEKKKVGKSCRGRLSYMDHENHFPERYSVLRPLFGIGRFQCEILRS